MREKIGKRIGPVPITLAVVALAAVLSVGALFAVNANSIQAQEIPAIPGTAAAGTGANDCEVTVINEDGIMQMGPVMGGGCTVSGDSVDVVLENASGDSRAVAVYTTGGDEYNVQAMNGMTALGKKGVNEDLFEIDEGGSRVGGGTAPGSQTITVSRDMADSDGEVYLFVYHATSTTDYTFSDTGIPFSLISGTLEGPAGARTYNPKTTTTLQALENAVVTAVNDALDKADDPPGNDGGVGLPDDPANISAASNVINMTTDEAVTLAAAKAAIKAITDDPEYTNPGTRAEGGTNVLNTLTGLKGLVDVANTAIDRLENVIGVVNGTTGSVNSFYATAADISIEVVFRSVATRGTDSDRDGAITGGEERSTLKVQKPPSKTNGEAAVEAIIKDANETPLAGFVDFTIEGDAEVLFKASSLKTHRAALGVAPAVAGSTGQVEVKGLSKTEPVRVKVTANYNNGELIQTVYLSRLGDAMEVEATAYSCRANEDDTDADVLALSGLACDYEIMSLTADKIAGNDPKELVSIGADDYFFIAGTAKDALGSTVDSLSSGKVTWKAADADARAVFVPTSSNTNTQIMIKSDADPGTYNITVEDSGKDASATVMVTVAGDASMISVSCDPEMIPTETGLTDCTVMVRDAADNIPSNLDTEIVDSPEQDQVQISVRGSSDIKADLIGPINNLINLDEQGMANFAIQMPLDAVEGARITVNVSTSIDDELLRNHTVVTYGDPPSEPGMPMNVMAMATSHDMITVSWESPAADGDSDITGYMVQRGYMDADNMMMWMDVDPAHMGMDKMYMDMGLMAETTYYYRVAAINSAGKGEYSDGMAMAMTMMMPPMELGDPSITSVMSDAAGMTTVMLMPGDNADQHWIWALPTDRVSEGMFSDRVAGDATSFTMSGLTSGMSYWFTAVAGRDMEDGTQEWSMYSGWSAETRIE